MNTDMATKITNQCSWQIQQNHSQKALTVIKETRTHSPYVISTCSRPPQSYATSPTPTDKDHDNYQHVVTNFDETVSEPILP